MLGFAATNIAEQLRRRGDPALVDLVYEIPADLRRAPGLLGYEPHYRGWLRKRATEEGDGPNAAEAEQNLPRAEPSICQTTPEGHIREPLDRDTPERTGVSDAEEMQREAENIRRRPRGGRSAGGPNSRTPRADPPAGGGRRRERSEEQVNELERGQQDKRQRTEETVDLEGHSEEHPDPHRASGSPVGGSGIAQTGPAEAPWAPVFSTVTGRQINRGDTAMDPTVAMGLAQGIALPGDLAAVPTDPRKIAIQMAQYGILVRT